MAAMRTMGIPIVAFFLVLVFCRDLKSPLATCIFRVHRQDIVVVVVSVILKGKEPGRPLARRVIFFDGTF